MPGKHQSTGGRLLILAICFLVAYVVVAMMPRYFRGHAPAFMVPIVRARVEHLTPGMTHQEVREELGVFDRFLDDGIGGGPLNRTSLSRSLRPDCGINFVFDSTSQPPRLVEAHLKGNGWSD